VSALAGRKVTITISARRMAFRSGGCTGSPNPCADGGPCYTPYRPPSRICPAADGRWNLRLPVVPAQLALAALTLGVLRRLGPLTRTRIALFPVVCHHGAARAAGGGPEHGLGAAPAPGESAGASAGCRA